jgi:hypothetical protein
MASVKVTNNPFSTTNSDYDVLVDQNTTGKNIQVVRLDLGSGTAESRAVGGIPFIAGTAVTVTESTGSVTTSSSQVLAANANRKGGYIQNISDTDIYLSWGGTATTSKTLLTPGSSLPLLITGLVYTGLVRAIHAGSGTKTLAIVELT